MSEDRTNKDPLLGGLDGMRAGQHRAGEPDRLKQAENGQALAENDTTAADPAEAAEKNAESFSVKENTAASGAAGTDAEAFSEKEIQTAELEAQKIAQELRREAIKTGNTEKETELPHMEPVKSQKKNSRKIADISVTHRTFSRWMFQIIVCRFLLKLSTDKCPISSYTYNNK